MRYLLDTNAMSHLIENRIGAISKRLQIVQGSNTIFTSIVAVSEVRFGYTKISSEKLRSAYESFFETITIENWEAPFDHVYAEMRSGLERRGRTIGAMDMLIAAHALATDATVVTDDRAFFQVEGLKTENWLRDEPAAIEQD